MTTEKNIDLAGCTYNDLSIEEHLARKPNPETKTVYKEEIRQKKNPNPIYRTPKYKPKKERNGKVETLTQEHKNKYVAKNYDKCKNIRQVILSLLLSGAEMTARDMLAYIEKEAPNHTVLREIIPKEKLDIKLIWNTMSILLRTDVGKLLIQTKMIQIANKGKKVRVYCLNQSGTHLTLEQITKMAKEKRTDLPKKVIEKVVEKITDKSPFSKDQLDRLDAAFEQIITKDEFKKYIEDINGKFESLKKNVNSLLDIPEKKMKGIASHLAINTDNPNVEVKVSGGVEISFKIVGLA